MPREASATQGEGQAVGPPSLDRCAGGGLSGREGHCLGARQIGDTVTLEGHPPGFQFSPASQGRATDSSGIN